jgi:hypothetical protein
MTTPSGSNPYRPRMDTPHPPDEPRPAPFEPEPTTPDSPNPPPEPLPTYEDQPPVNPVARTTVWPSMRGRAACGFSRVSGARQIA